MLQLLPRLPNRDRDPEIDGEVFHSVAGILNYKKDKSYLKSNELLFSQGVAAEL